MLKTHFCFETGCFNILNTGKSVFRKEEYSPSDIMTRLQDVKPEMLHF